MDIKENSNEIRTNLCSSKPSSSRTDVNSSAVLDSSATKKIISIIPRERQQLLKWNGWGYKDSKFVIAESDQEISFTGSRYPIGELRLPYFKQWVEEMFNLDLRNSRPSQPLPTSYPEPKICNEFLNHMNRLKIYNSKKGEDRLIRAHGQTLYDIHTLREGEFARIPDLVVWPTCHDEVVQIVKYANEYNVAIIPFGGGTSVSGSITCPKHETRSIVVLDTSQMNKMLWLDKENLVVCFEAGIFGQELERELHEYGLTVGHEPDSYEFSTLGGWVATRASGMKKNVYGNIEDIVVRVRMVTSKGVLERNCSAPRVSCGPDFNHIILGSEGTLGVVTEVVLKVRTLPQMKVYGSLIFPVFENGIECLREVAENRYQPSSIRLIDNDQFRFGQALKPAGTFFSNIIEGMKKAYITKIKRFDLTKMCVATLLFEGKEDDVKQQQQKIYDIAKKHGGLPAGAQNGERGYVLTFVIAYIRDLALEHFIVAESFETSMPWNRCAVLCRNTKQRVRKECAKIGIQYYLISCRVTQTYDAGAAVYFYFGFNYIGLNNPVAAYEYIESCARDEILACGGSISHHHGVGKLRKKWYPQSVTDVGVGLYKAAKTELDPKNIFAVGNLIRDEFDEEEAISEHDEYERLGSKL